LDKAAVRSKKWRDERRMKERDIKKIDKKER
jgi:hypothetical protein